MERVRLGLLVLTFSVLPAAFVLGTAGCDRTDDSPAGPGGPGVGGRAGTGGGPSVGGGGTGVGGATGAGATDAGG